MTKTIQKYGLLCLMLLAVVAGLYGQFLQNPIVFDDMPFFMVDGDGVQPVSSYHLAPFMLRSLPYATLAWTKMWFGLEMVNFRIGNLLLHAAVVLALFAFLVLLFTAVVGPGAQNRLSSCWAAFFAALLFALHPVSTYTAGYLVQRTTLMAALFSLLAMWVYVHGSTRQKPLWLWLSVPFYYLAVLSKEHAIMLPAVLVLLTVLLHPDWRQKFRQRWGIFAGLTAIAIFVFLARKGLLGSVYEPVAATMLIDIKLAYPLSVVTQCWLFFKYVFLWLFPNPTWMSIDMREPFAASLFSVYLLAAVAFVAWGVGALWLVMRRGMLGLLGFSMLFPWLMFFTEFSSVRIQEIFVLYRSYLWVLGALCLLPVIFAKVESRSALFILSLVVLAMFPISMERLMVMSNPMFLWDDAEKLVKGRTDLPGAYRIYYNRGTEMASLGMFDAAISDFKQAIVLSPHFPESYGNLGAAYAQKGDWDNAIVFSAKAIEAAKRGGNTFAQAQGNMGTAYLQKGEFKKSTDSFTTAIEIAKSEGKSPIPRDVHGRAQAYEKMGELAKAQADYRESCRLGKRGCEKVFTSAH